MSLLPSFDGHRSGTAPKRAAGFPHINSVCAVLPASGCPGRGKVDILKYQEDVSADEVIKRAESRLGERAYKLLLNNCEHFATWCVTGKAKSKQVRRATTTVMGTLAVVGGVLVVVARKGLQRA